MGTLLSKCERTPPSEHSQNIKQIHGKNKIPLSLLPQHYIMMLLLQCAHNPDIRILVAHDSYQPINWYLFSLRNQISPLLLIPFNELTKWTFRGFSVVVLAERRKLLHQLFLKKETLRTVSIIKGGDFLLSSANEPTAQDLNFLPYHFNLVVEIIYSLIKQHKTE